MSSIEITSQDSRAANWDALVAGSSINERCAGWLKQQCGEVAGVLGGLVLLNSPDGGPFAPAAFWPDEGSRKPLSEAAQQAIAERSGLVLQLESDSAEADPIYEIAQPIELAGTMRGAAVLELSARSNADLHRALDQLRWGSAWIALILATHHPPSQASTHPLGMQGSEPQTERMRSVLELVAAIHERDRYRDSATHLATELAAKLDCERVSVAALHAKRLRVQAMSNSAEFGKHANLVRAIEGAMEESAEFGRGLAFPRDDAGAVPAFAHAELAREFGTGAICSVPFYRAGLICGALCLERASLRPFEAEEQAVAEAAAALCGPALEALRQEDRSWLAKSRAALREQVQQVLGPHHTIKKLVVTAVLALLLFLIFATGEHRVTAKAVLEAELSRAAVAPFTGYLAEAPVRAGDAVKAGDLLARLDDRELRLEQRRWSSELAQYEKQGREALAERDAARVRILAASADQARAQLGLIEHQLDQLEVRSAIDGLVVSGDLSQSLGAPFERGDVFFEIAPLEDYRLVLSVDESDIRGVAIGTQGNAILASSPDDPIVFEVVKVTPVSSAEEGGNFFRVEGRLAQTPTRLQPGMEGIGKIELGSRNLFWIWTHKAVDWLRLATWRWLP